MRNIEELEKEGWIRNFECVAGDWELFPAQFVTYIEQTDSKARFQLGFRVMRKGEYLIQNGFVMIYIIFSIIFTSFGIILGDPVTGSMDAMSVSDAVSSRLSIIVTVTLTLIALKFALSDKMPASICNWLDLYLNISVLCCLIMMAIFSLYTHNIHRMSVNTDKFIFFATFTTWNFYNISFCACLLIKTRSMNSHIVKTLGKPLVSTAPNDRVMHYYALHNDR